MALACSSIHLGLQAHIRTLRLELRASFTTQETLQSCLLLRRALFCVFQGGLTMDLLVCDAGAYLKLRAAAKPLISRLAARSFSSLAFRIQS